MADLKSQILFVEIFFFVESINSIVPMKNGPIYNFYHALQGVSGSEISPSIFLRGGGLIFEKAYGTFGITILPLNFTPV